MHKMKKIVILAGEASGDIIGAHLMKQLRTSNSTIKFTGIGGKQMEKLGFKSIFPISDLSVMGLLEIIPHIPKLLRRVNETSVHISTTKPDAVVTIDSKGFNFRVLKKLSSSSISKIKTFHIVTPSVWAYKNRKANNLDRIICHMMAILPFEPAYFQDNNVPTTFIGHPATEFLFDHTNIEDLTSIVKCKPAESMKDRDLCINMNGQPRPKPNQVMESLPYTKTNFVHQALEKLTFPIPQKWSQSKGNLVCFCPGSRRNEISKSLPVMKEVLSNLLLNKPDIHVVFPVNSNVKPLLQEVMKQWPQELHQHVELLNGDDVTSKLTLFHNCDVALAVSGTVVTELALCNAKTVVMYRANFLTEWIASWLANVDYVSIPNIMAGKELIPEFIFSRCTPDKITQSLLFAFDKRIKEQDDVLDQLELLLPIECEYIEKQKHYLIRPIRPSQKMAAIITNEMKQLQIK